MAKKNGRSASTWYPSIAAGLALRPPLNIHLTMLSCRTNEFKLHSSRSATRNRSRIGHFDRPPAMPRPWRRALRPTAEIYPTSLAATRRIPTDRHLESPISHRRLTAIQADLHLLRCLGVERFRRPAQIPHALPQSLGHVLQAAEHRPRCLAHLGCQTTQQAPLLHQL